MKSAPAGNCNFSVSHIRPDDAKVGGVLKKIITAIMNPKVTVTKGIHQNRRRKNKNFCTLNLEAEGAWPFTVGSVNWKPGFGGGMGVSSFITSKANHPVRNINEISGLQSNVIIGLALFYDRSHVHNECLVGRALPAFPAGYFHVVAIRHGR